MPIAVFNTTGWERSECMVIKKPDTGAANYSAGDSDGNKLAVQTSADKVYVFIEKVPSLGYKVIYLNEEKVALNSKKSRKMRLKFEGELEELETVIQILSNKLGFKTAEDEKKSIKSTL
jgi:hypothetical protein